MKLIHIAFLFFLGLNLNAKKGNFVETNGVKIYYEVYGEGEPLLLLHGFTISGKSWEAWIEDLSKSPISGLCLIMAIAPLAFMTENLCGRTPYLKLSLIFLAETGSNSGLAFRSHDIDTHGNTGYHPNSELVIQNLGCNPK